MERSQGALVLRQHTLVTKVVIEGGRAIGVEYAQGESLYRADPRSTTGASLPPTQVGRAAREVILSAGPFNTPQLLKLSGIGPGEELEAHGIDVVVDAPGVGRNLQDRYEVTVVDRVATDYPVFEGSRLDAPAPDETPDALFTEWRDERSGPFTTNGTLAAYIKRSSVATTDPDLFVFSLPVFFRGYYPDYSIDFRARHDVVSWAVLKAHTNNVSGQVRLRSADPRDTPDINFAYFEEGNDTADDDLDAVVDGVEFARSAPGWVTWSPRRSCPGATWTPATKSGTTCETKPGATTPHALSRSGPTLTQWRFWTRSSVSAASRGCASSTRQSSHASPGSSSRRPST